MSLTNKAAYTKKGAKKELTIELNKNFVTFVILISLISILNISGLFATLQIDYQ